MEATNPPAPIHNIGVVERRTGIKADLVRAWERRYGAVVPARTSTARRLYSDADIERLSLLRDATRAGHRISHIASLPDDDLRGLIALHVRSIAPVQTTTRRRPASLDDRLARCLLAVEALDGQQLATELERASFNLGHLAIVENLLVPLMARLGSGWLDGEFDPAHEHLATSVIRNFVSGFLNAPDDPQAPVLLVTTPSGQLHELGAILAAATAASEGWRIVYLGPSLPAASIVAAAQRCKASVVALSIVFPEGTPDLESELATVVRSLDDTAVLLGGPGTTHLAALADRHGIQIVRSLDDMRSALANYH